MKRFRSITALAVLAAACTGKTVVLPGDAGLLPPTGDGGTSTLPTATPAPYRLTCTFYTRDLSNQGAPPPPFTQTQAIFYTDKPGTQTFPNLAKGISATVSLAAASDPNDVVLSIDLPASGLTHTFELSAESRVDFDFVGNQGFSGLNYVTTPNSGIDLQYICESSPYDEARPKPQTFVDAGADPGTTTPAHSPLSIRCTVGSQSLTFDHTLAQPQVVTEGDAGKVTFSYVDGAPPDDPGFGDERTLSFQIGTTTQLLYQMNPYAAFTPPLRGAAALTGTITANGLTVSCSPQ